MALVGQGFELVGLSLFGPEPLGEVHLSLSGGLSVLYGLNGSGKTSILRAAEAVLSGVGPRYFGGEPSRNSCLHIRITALQEDPATFDTSSFESSLIDSFMPEWQEEVPCFTTRFDLWKRLLNDCLSQEVDQEWIWDDSVLAHQKSISFCLVPIGSLDRPLWGTYLSAELSELEWTELKSSLGRQRSALEDILENGRTGKVGAALAASQYHPLAAFGATPWTTLVAGQQRLEREYLDQWPSSFPLPISWLGQVSTAPVHVISDKGTVLSTRDATNDLLIRMADEHGELIEISVGLETQFNPYFTSAVTQLEASANGFLKLTGPHFFTLELELKGPSEWFVGKIPEWGALIDGAHISIARLSGAELRWALAALQWAISDLDTGRPQVFLIDEPERGLHRLRERELPKMLQSLCHSSDNLTVFTASHSPAFLDVRVGADLHHVTRLRGYPSILHTIDSASNALMSETAESLGLSASDLLQLTRVFVLVEGAHDEIVLGQSLGEDIRRVGGRIIPIHGASHSRSVAEARILFDATDANVVLVLDNIIAADALEIWNQATELYFGGNGKAAKTALAPLGKLGTGGEALWLQALGERAVDTKVLHRIRPFGLSKRDILCYLPPRFFIDGSNSWEDLENAYELARSRGVTRDNFKSWLTTMRGAKFLRENIREAARSTDLKLDIEFGDLLLTIQTLALLGPVDDLTHLSE